MATDTRLQEIMPNLDAAKRALCLPHLNAAMQARGIDAPLHTAAFVAQLVHESGEFSWMEARGAEEGRAGRDGGEDERAGEGEGKGEETGCEASRLKHRARAISHGFRSLFIASQARARARLRAFVRVWSCRSSIQNV